ncbi:MAG: TrbI/VirB10 family protein [Gammaproteobacteria bacterium]
MKLSNKTKNSTLESGLPEVAQKYRNKKPIVLVIFGIILIVFLFVHFHTKSGAKVTAPVEETYTPQNQVSGEVNKIEVPVTAGSVSEPKLDSQITSEAVEEHKLYIQEKEKELQQRLSAPLMLVASNSGSKPVEASSNTSSQSQDPNTQFMNQVSMQDAETINATSIGSLSSVIAEGSLIHAILEPATDSDLPGYLRAIVSEPCYSEDGSQILVPVGSRLIGQYKSGMTMGQSRIFIVWTRLLTPAGISINLGSPGVDSLGVAGMGADEINRHFWARFGTASLLSIMGVGAANSGVSGDDQANSASAYRAAIANSFSQSAAQSLQQESMIPPTLKTYQGKPIMVFVAHDLSFQNVIKQGISKIKVF